MAASLVLATATPNALKYTYTGSGTGSKTATQMIADCAAGPLKTFLSQVNSGLNAGISGLTWAGLLQSMPLSVTSTLTSSTGGAVAECLLCGFTTGPNAFQGVSPTADSVTAIVEVRFKNSIDR